MDERDDGSGRTGTGTKFQHQCFVDDGDELNRDGERDGDDDEWDEHYICGDWDVDLSAG